MNVTVCVPVVVITIKDIPPPAECLHVKYLKRM